MDNAQSWTLEQLETYLLSETHHGRPGLSAAKKCRLARGLQPDAERWIPLLARSPVAGAREVAARLIAPLWHNRADFDSLVLALASDDDWEVREWAAAPFVDRYAASPGESLPQYVAWADSAPDGVKRAIAVAVKSLAQRPDLEVDPLWTILDHVAVCEAEYVRKNLGPFVVGDGLLPRYPEESLVHLKAWSHLGHWAARWNAAAAFTAKKSRKYREQGLYLLHGLADDSDARVRRVAQKALKIAQ